MNRIIWDIALAITTAAAGGIAVWAKSSERRRKNRSQQETQRWWQRLVPGPKTSLVIVALTLTLSIAKAIHLTHLEAEQANARSVELAAVSKERDELSNQLDAIMGSLHYLPRRSQDFSIRIYTGGDGERGSTTEPVRFRLIAKSGQRTHWIPVPREGDNFGNGNVATGMVTTYPPLEGLAQVQVQKFKKNGDGWKVARITVRDEHNGIDYEAEAPDGITFNDDVDPLHSPDPKDHEVHLYLDRPPVPLKQVVR